MCYVHLIRQVLNKVKTEHNSLKIEADNQSHQAQLSKSDIFGILQNDRRRCVLEILHKQGNQSIRFLSEEIARLESGEDDPKSTIRKSIYVSLLQTHIPKMESLGVVNHDRENDFVELLPAASNFDIYMETVKKGDIPWSHFYVGLSILAVVGSVTIYLGLFELVTSNQWMLFMSSLFIISSIAHMRHVRKL
ncbi:DUF7344 domain-containing protein [Methanosarcina barkeri]|uniref:DUF7344 domain-containing protein n=5 Tax=Methanosarcina TaxID=2207 RepID=A0A0E3QX25_METBA|nr:hypothetical protein [Methanosarcina barkeri]AKB55344.1 hypothetical protein MSBRM_2346 [Methanosarcina barkeri MS]AKB56584.1 hypothetical protein MSBR2_0068 [Methanosarcina barkeri 227]AKJ37165.1 hypothetical protein MCM1_0038 [Methanosarcina barkeri CM1]